MVTNFRKLGPRSRVWIASRNNLQSTEDFAVPAGTIIDDNRIIEVNEDQEVLGFAYWAGRITFGNAQHWGVNVRDSHGIDFMQNEDVFVSAEEVSNWDNVQWYMPTPKDKRPYRYIFRFQKNGPDQQPLYWAMYTLQSWTQPWLNDPRYWDDPKDGFHANKTPWFGGFTFTLKGNSNIQTAQPIFVDRDTFITGISPGIADGGGTDQYRIMIRASADATGPGLMAVPTEIHSIGTTVINVDAATGYAAIERHWPGAYFVSGGSQINIDIHRAATVGEISDRVVLRGWQF